MVRQDIHALPFQFQIAMAALMFVALGSTPRSRIVVAVFAIASLDLGVITVTEWWPQFLPSFMDRLTGVAAIRSLDSFLHWPTTVGTLEATTKQALMPCLLYTSITAAQDGSRGRQQSGRWLYSS